MRASRAVRAAVPAAHLPLLVPVRSGYSHQSGRAVAARVRSPSPARPSAPSCPHQAVPSPPPSSSRNPAGVGTRDAPTRARLLPPCRSRSPLRPPTPCRQARHRWQGGAGLHERPHGKGGEGGGGAGPLVVAGEGHRLHAHLPAARVPAHPVIERIFSSDASSLAHAPLLPPRSLPLVLSRPPPVRPLIAAAYQRARPLRPAPRSCTEPTYEATQPTAQDPSSTMRRPCASSRVAGTL